VLALAPLLAGCGIRTTSVPVDAGPAPSRVSCAGPNAPATPEPDTVVRQVYLVCSMQIAPVEREVRAREGKNVRLSHTALAQDLIEQLQISPRQAEASAGFSTAVPGTLAVSAPHGGDRRDAIRLSLELDELPSFALAQIVCTLTADAAVAPDHSVVLGGPAGGDELRRYTCTSDLRTHPEAADTAGIPVT
jgi:hypothetical protein